MREIKFRGKRLDNNSWIYGDLIQHQCGDTFIGDNLGYWTDDGFHKDDYKEVRAIDDDTVGQFTGLYDKKGKEIYEGDIIQLDYITTLGKHRIGFSFEVKWCTQEGCWVGWDGFVENSIQQTHKMFVVKGNIYDNPELLEGK